MPEYFPEIDKALWTDTEVRSLQKIVSKLGGGLNGDLFGRTKIGLPATLFDASHVYQDNGEFADDVNGEGASVSYLVNQSSALLGVGTASGERVYRESKKVFTYQPGKSLQVLQTFVFNTAKENLRQRAGYFSAQNGFFLEQDGFNVYFVKRSFISGGVVDTRIPQSEWNRDKLDGTGPSAIKLDLSKAQILYSEYEWLGVGAVVMGFVINGGFIVAHQFDHGNVLSSVYITSATLPVRYEIENIGDTTSSSSMKQICVSITSNGGYEKKSVRYVIRKTTGVAAPAANVLHPLVSIKLASDKLNAVILPSQYHLQPVTSGRYEFFVIKNGVLTGASYNTTTFPNVDFDTSATSISGGQIIDHGYFDATAQASTPVLQNAEYNFSYQLGRNSFTGTSDVVTLAFSTLTNTGNPEALGAVSFYDLT